MTTPPRNDSGSDPRIPRAVPEAAIRASGELGQKPLAWVLLDALDGRYMGYLDLRRQRIHKRVCVMMGFPVFVESALRSETLGQLLVSSGRLRPEQHRQALQLMADQQLMYGEALIHLQLMEEQEVLQTLEVQVRRKIEPCLSWEEGTWEYWEDPSVASRVQRYTVDPVDLVFGSLPRYLNMEQELDYLGVEAEHHRLELLPRGRDLAHRFTACFGERLLGRLERGCSIAELLGYDGLHETVEQVFVLLQCGMARRARHEQPSEALSAAGSGADAFDLERLALRATTAKMKPIRAAVGQPRSEDEPDEEAREAQQLIDATYLGLFSQDHYELLELPRDCSPETVQAAYEARRLQFDPSRLAALDLGEEREYLDEIWRHLDEAFQVLSDARRRQQYDVDLQQLDESHHRMGSSLRAERVYETGEQLVLQESHGEAAAAFGEARQEDDQAEYRTMEAWSLFRANGETSEAAITVLPMVIEELERTPGQYMIHLVAARLHRAAGQHEQTMEQYQQVLQLNPCLPKVIDELEGYLQQTAQDDLLEQQYRRILLHLGDRDHNLAADLWKRLTVLYHHRLEDHSRARKALEVARYMDESDPQVQELELELFPDDDEDD